ncbi:MAG TPA: hypothetical protein VJ917_00200 [Saprospiraceae bacterium]|nr:hypothetical protein [Saprospiraceae bacterium]
MRTHILFITLVLLFLSSSPISGQIEVSLEGGIAFPKITGYLNGSPFVLTNPNVGQTVASNDYYRGEGFYLGLITQKQWKEKWMVRMPVFFSVRKFIPNQAINEDPLYLWYFQHRNQQFSLAPELVYQWKYGLEAGIGWHFNYSTEIKEKKSEEWTTKEVDNRHFNLGPQVSLRFNRLPFYLDMRYAWVLRNHFSETVANNEQEFTGDFKIHQLQMGLGYYLAMKEKRNPRTEL